MTMEIRQNWKAIRDTLVFAGAMGAVAGLNWLGANLVDTGLSPMWIAILSPVIGAAGLWVHRYARPTNGGTK